MVLLRSFPVTPSKEATSPGSYSRPSRLSNERFSNIKTTTWSRALLRSGRGMCGSYCHRLLIHRCAGRRHGQVGQRRAAQGEEAGGGGRRRHVCRLGEE